MTYRPNFYVNGTLVLNHGAYTDCAIVDMGDVRGLGKINNIPTNGWTNSVSIKPGNGYIIRSKTYDQYTYENIKQYCHYARIYVVDWIENTSGGIIGATIRYQDHWK